MGKKRSSKRKKNLRSNLLPYLVCLAVVTILAGLIFKLIANKKIPCANSISCQESFKLKIENNAMATFENRKIYPPKISLLNDYTRPPVLGASSEEKHIFVDLAAQTLYAYEGKKLYFQTLISSGKWGRTPTGDFKIWVKLRATRMTGGSGADYYDLPNVPYVMFFYNDQVSQSTGFSLHGTYWHNNFGHPMSHGCVNMRSTDAQKLYEWASPVTDGNTTYSNGENPGTKVTIYGEAPA